jgi:hypothetical protein
MLVAAVLRPEEREDRQLEVVRVTPEQVDDARQLAIREAKCSMQRLFRDLRQVIQSRREARRRRPRWERR